VADIGSPDFGIGGVMGSLEKSRKSLKLRSRRLELFILGGDGKPSC
jgi:hypothetical protein